MRFSAVYAAFFVAGAGLSAPAVHAQAMQDWSAIEVRPSAGKAHKAPPPATVALTGPTAALLPNAAQPAPGSHLKGDSTPLSGVLVSLTKLRPVRFEFLPGQGDAGSQYGLLPGDLARVYPELVRTNLITGTQTINTAQLTPLLVEAIKELNDQLQVLQKQQYMLAEAYARLVQQQPAAAPARAASAGPSFLRRGRSQPKAPVAEPAAEVTPATAETNLD
jgi:hypothetical protein